MEQIDELSNGNVLMSVGFCLKRQRGRTKIIVDGELVSEDGRDLTILRAIARARRWQKLLDDGVFKTTSEIAEVLQTDQSYVARTIRLAYLAPRIVRLFLEDKAPPRLSLAKMMKAFPEDWNEQYMHFGIEPEDS